MSNVVEYQSKNACITEDLFSQKIYWLNQLSGERPETNLIPDYVRSAIGSSQRQTLPFELSPAWSRRLIQLTQGSNFSLYLVLLTALNVWLFKYTGHDDLTIGIPIYQPLDSHNSIYPIVPLRVRVTRHLTFKDLLFQVKEVVIAAYSHPDYPFDELRQSLELPKRQKDQAAVFDVICLLENIHTSHNLAEMTNDLTVSFRIDETIVKGTIDYNQSLFQNETIQLVLEGYINIIQCVLENSDIKLADVAILSDFRKHQLLYEFNSCVPNHYPVDRSLHYLFEEQVRQSPDAIAAIDQTTQISYQELNQKANQLARFLRQLGVQPGEFIGILKQRDIDFLLAILAILKAGGAYVPIDSSYPFDRITYMLSNSEVRIALTDSELLNSFTMLEEHCPHLQHLICLGCYPAQTIDAQLKTPGIQRYTSFDFNECSTENLEKNAGGIDPAYMMYTSGSTGLPKGAIIRHGGAINHIYAQFDALKLTQTMAFLQSAAASSDISVWQFLAPLLIGGKTVIVNTDVVYNPATLFQVIQANQLTLIELVPVVLKELMDYVANLPIESRALPNLQWIMVTGESVPVELVNQWLRLYPSIPIVNAYGPTEAADDVTQLIVEAPLADQQRSVPIGQPLANLNVYILDAQMQLVPIGAAGEICVSGFGVGAGYWKNDESTRSHFVLNPFPNAKPLPGTANDFIYKTGDLGRWLANGTIEFLGRIDHQVKIRGFRVELGEIEAALNQHVGVQDAAVIAQVEALGRQRLVAYIVANVKPAPTSTELRHFLNETLPDYMVPSIFVMLDALPLTPSGKVDRNALPQPNMLRPSLDVAYVMPQTEAERVIAAVWQKALNVERVGTQDNFFDLGGHSLIMLQVYSKLREIFKTDLSIIELFRYPTISTLAQFLSQTDRQSVSSEIDRTDKREAGKSRLKQRLKQRQR